MSFKKIPEALVPDDCSSFEIVKTSYQKNTEVLKKLRADRFLRNNGRLREWERERTDTEAS